MAKQDLPPGLRARQQASGKVYFYLKADAAEKELPLGPDRGAALAAWRRHTLARCLAGAPVTRIGALLDTFRIAEVPMRDLRSRPALEKQLTALSGFFDQCGEPWLAAAWPTAETYLEHRGTQCELRACAEIRLLIHVWVWGQRLAILDRRLECPWTSIPAHARIRRGVAREVGAALIGIAQRGGASLPTRYMSGAIAASPVLQRDPRLSAGVVSPHSSGTRSAQPGTDRVTDETAARMFLRAAARQLVVDGRRDLAREVLHLPPEELHAVIDLARQESNGKLEGQLILGTGRAIRLDELRAAKRAKAR